MSFGDYLTGVLGLAAIAVAMGLAGVRLRGRLLPGWGGAPARLVEAVIGLSILTLLFQLLGAVGLFEPYALVAASSSMLTTPLRLRARIRPAAPYGVSPAAAASRFPSRPAASPRPGS